MFWIDVLFAFLVVLLLSLVLFGWLGWRRRPEPDAGGLLFAFVLFFLLTWAAGAWLAPIGPALWGGYWLSFLVAGLVFMLLFLVLVPPAGPVEPSADGEPLVEPAPRTRRIATLDAFSWLLFLGLAIVLLVAYL